MEALTDSEEKVCTYEGGENIRVGFFVLFFVCWFFCLGLVWFGFIFFFLLKVLESGLAECNTDGGHRFFSPF